MTQLNAVESDTTTTITLTTTATAQCPFEDHTDEYTVGIQYRPNGRIIELGSLNEWFTEYETREITQEAFCDAVYGSVRDTVRPVWVRVVVRGVHSGIRTVVTRP